MHLFGNIIKIYYEGFYLIFLLSIYSLHKTRINWHYIFNINFIREANGNIRFI